MSDAYPDIQFTAVIPTYNRGKLAVRAIHSALAQTKQPLEILLVDDGSTDNTRELVNRFDAPVRYIHQTNGGSAVARNNGMRQAKCEWIALLDSDDIWHQDHLEKMAQAIQATNGAANFYFADTLRPPDKGGGNRWKWAGFAISTPISLNVAAADWVLNRPQPMMLQSAVFKKSAYLAGGGFLPSLRYREDTHLFLKLGLAGPACAVNNIGARMTSDDDPENRLTLIHNNHIRAVQMQIIMFSDLLHTMANLPKPLIQELKSRLADAHLNTARHAWRTRHYLKMLLQLTRSALIHPFPLLNTLHRKLHH